jgi:hypothetical protein
LEYLSIGSGQNNTGLTFKGIIAYLQSLPKLKKVWFDGVEISEEEASSFNKFECIID